MQRHGVGVAQTGQLGRCAIQGLMTASCFATSRSEISTDREYYQNQSQRSIMEKTASWNLTNLGAHVGSGGLQ